MVILRLLGDQSSYSKEKIMAGDLNNLCNFCSGVVLLSFLSVVVWMLGTVLWRWYYQIKDKDMAIEGTHKHKCKFCGWVWQHSDSCDVKHGDEGYHECPSCGRCNWGMGIYEGDEKPSEFGKQGE